MTRERRDTLGATVPYVLWMVLMMVLPSTAVGYAIRAFVSFVALFALYPKLSDGAADRVVRNPWATAGWGIGIGVLVGVLWVAPESFAWYRRFLVIGGGSAETFSPYDPSVCGWPLTLWRIVGSAFVIAPAEELFFRSFLYRRLQTRRWTELPLSTFDWSAFLWMVGLFALEHDRILVGALAGAFYGWLAIRRGLGAAILAHVTTNLLLGLYVIGCGEWGFW